MSQKDLQGTLFEMRLEIQTLKKEMQAVQRYLQEMKSKPTSMTTESEFVDFPSSFSDCSSGEETLGGVPLEVSLGVIASPTTRATLEVASGAVASPTARATGSRQLPLMSYRTEFSSGWRQGSRWQPTMIQRQNVDNGVVSTYMRVVGADCRTCSVWSAWSSVVAILYGAAAVEVLVNNNWWSPSESWVSSFAWRCKVFGWSLCFLASWVQWLNTLVLFRTRPCRGFKKVALQPLLRWFALGVCSLVIGNFVPVFWLHISAWDFLRATWTVVYSINACFHLASALLLQSDMCALRRALRQLSGTGTPDRAAHERVLMDVHGTKRRWFSFLLFHLIPEIAALGLFVVSAFLDATRRNVPDVIADGSNIAYFLCVMLCQLTPLVEYNEAVRRAKLRVEEFVVLQRFLRLPLEFKIFGVAYYRRSFNAFLATGMSGACSVLARRVFNYV